MRRVAIGSAAFMLIAAPLVSVWEGKRNEAYLDPVGIPTVCHGYTNGVELGQYYTDEQCYHLLTKELEHAARVVDARVTAALPPERKAALMSFVYNAGANNFAKSTMLKKLNAGDVVGACNELRKWVYARGIKLKGLIKRREAERELCLRGVERAVAQD